ncbi:MAG: hypothetical protein A2Y40_07130 [Candidatus Margulisbacteria bacterium GWF2_35_9]|nr:MAG: hypothetical protein A2Y40_07130 [Candidatus Margulisbacteria bacterium GWF2_35_9]
MAAKKKNTDYYFEELKKLQFKKEVIGIIILAVAFFLYLGNKYVLSTGIIGQFVFGHLLDAVIGQGKYVLPHFFAVTGLIILFGSTITREKTRVPGIIYGFVVYLMMLELQLGMVTPDFKISPIGSHVGGVIGYCLTFVFKSFFGFHGLKIILISSVLISLLMIFNLTLLEIFTLFINSVHQGVDFAFNSIQQMNKQKKVKAKALKEKPIKVARQDLVKKEIQAPIYPVIQEPLKPLKTEVKKEDKDSEQLSELDLHRIERVESSNDDFILPDLKLLTEIKVPKDYIKKMENDMKITIQKLEETLESFKVNARVVSTSQGPTVTRYELQPGFGVKVSKIVNLADDIALNLAAKGVRIEAPVPGKSVVGIEIPNQVGQTISMLPLAQDEHFLFSSSPLLIALGKDLEGKSVYADITKMPHMLIAGATGSGKSVCVNSILISLLLRNTPSTVRMIMIDPKKVELNVYDDIPHLIAPVVTDAKKAAVTLRWCVREMERRYEEMSALGVRNIDGYNKKIDEIRAERDSLPEEEQNEFFVPRKHPYIVVVIDELADLMLAAAAEVETSIARIAQMARAVGLHLVIATQRPSVDVITGLIKANVPSRISFAVSSQIDSRTILDGMGAEKLLGKGDMLYKPVGSMRSVRIQGAYISDKEVHDIVNFVKSQGKPEYLQEVVNLKAEDLKELNKKSSDDGSAEDVDDFFEEAKELIIQNKVASISYIQRKLRIGYNRAARIMDQMEEAGIVSAPDSEGKGRKVLF